MKRALFIFACAFALVCFGSCSKNGTDPEEKLDDRLVGTKWQTYDLAYFLFHGGDPYEVYEFVSTTEVEDYVTNKGSVVQTHGTYTYKLDYPKITINKKKSDGIIEALHYTFKDTRTMVRDDVDESNNYAKFIKQ